MLNFYYQSTWRGVRFSTTSFSSSSELSKSFLRTGERWHNEIIEWIIECYNYWLNEGKPEQKKSNKIPQTPSSRTLDRVFKFSKLDLFSYDAFDWLNFPRPSFLSVSEGLSLYGNKKANEVQTLQFHVLVRRFFHHF